MRETENLQQPVAEFDGTNLPQPVAQIPWGQNIVLVEKIKDPIQRLWYAQKTIENGWSRAVLVAQIESNLFERQGKALTNFSHTLPQPQSDLAREVLKDPPSGLLSDNRQRIVISEASTQAPR